LRTEDKVLVQNAYPNRNERLVYALWRALVWVPGLVPLLATPFWPRSFDLLQYGQALEEGFGGARVFAQAITLLVTLLALSLILLGLMLQRSVLQRGLLPLLVGVFLLGLGPLLSTFFGLSPQFSLTHIAVPLILISALLLPPVPLEWLVSEAKRLSLVYILGSLLAVAIAPSWALEIPYTQGYIPGFDVRLHGLTVHANKTSLFPLVYLLLEASFPSKSRFRWLTILAALAVLLLNQTKTAWALLLLGLGMGYVFDLFRKVTLLKLAFFMSALFAFAAFFGFVFLGRGEIFEEARLLLEERQEDVTTLTGRSYIWAVVLEIVQENPWFGYGPHLWDPEMTITYAPLLRWVPAQSHNQYIESLGEAGYIGLLGLVLYGLILLRTGWLYRSVGRGILFILPFLWFARGVTESWYRRGVITDANLIVHLLIFALLVLALKNSKERGLS